MIINKYSFRSKIGPWNFRHSIMVVACVLLSACQTTSTKNEISASSDPSAGTAISSDLDLYNMCAKDIDKTNFPNTACGLYLQGFLTSYIYTSITFMGLLPGEQQEKALRNFGKCDRGSLQLEIIAREFVKAAGEHLNDSSRTFNLGDPGVFFFHYINECKMPEHTTTKVGGDRG